MTRSGRRLREFSVKTRHTEDKSARGYFAEDFADAFARYLPAVEDPSEGVQAVRDPQLDLDADAMDAIGHLPNHGAIDIFDRPSGKLTTRPSPGNMPRRRCAVAAPTLAPTSQRQRNASGPGR